MKQTCLLTLLFSSSRAVGAVTPVVCLHPYHTLFQVPSDTKFLVCWNGWNIVSEYHFMHIYAHFPFLAQNRPFRLPTALFSSITFWDSLHCPHHTRFAAVLRLHVFVRLVSPSPLACFSLGQPRPAEATAFSLSSFFHVFSAGWRHVPVVRLLLMDRKPSWPDLMLCDSAAESAAKFWVPPHVAVPPSKSQSWLCSPEMVCLTNPPQPFLKQSLLLMVWL